MYQTCQMNNPKTIGHLQNRNNRNGKIEFLRFLFAVIIVVHHSRSFLGDVLSPFLGGSLGVEFFFFVSGYLMMATIEKKNQLGEPSAVGRETMQYLKKKWVSVIPESIISWVLAFGIMCVAQGNSIRDAVIRLIDSIWEPLFLTMTGLGQRGVNGVVWYISAMLICMAILYPLLRKYHDITINLIIPLTSLCILGYLCKNFGTPRDPTKWLGWTYKGVLRGFAELEIGCLLYYFTKAICRYNYTLLGRWILSIAENLMYLIVIYFMYLTGANKHDYLFIALMAIAVALTFSGVGIDCGLFNNKIAIYLGRFSIPLYFGHTFWASALNFFVPTTWRIRYRLVVYLVLAFATAGLVMYLATGVRKYGPHLCETMKKYIIEDSL